MARGYTARMTTFEDTPEDPLVRQEEDAAAAEAASIGGRAPEYDDEEGDAASEAERAVIEGGEGVEEGFETAESDLREAASHGESRFDPGARDFGDDESAGDADAVSGEPDEVDVTETVRDPEAGPGEDPGEGPGISHDR
jgi:hypothetical protein